MFPVTAISHMQRLHTLQVNVKIQGRISIKGSKDMDSVLIFLQLKKLEKMMATVEEELALLNASYGQLAQAFTDMQTRVTNDLTNLQTQIAQLQQQVQGNLSADQVQAFQTFLNQLAATTQAIQAVDVPPAPIPS